MKISRTRISRTRISYSTPPDLTTKYFHAPTASRENSERRFFQAIENSGQSEDAAVLLCLFLLLPQLHRHAIDLHVVLNGNYKAAASADELGLHKI